MSYNLRARDRRPFVYLMAFIGLSVVTRLVVSHVDVINVDEASYMVGAWELLQGRLPYTAFGDNKPPLIYAYYAVAQLLGGRGIEGVRLVTALVTTPLTALAVSAFYRHDRRGVVAAVLFLLYSASYTASDMLAVNCEPVMMLPLAWALVAIRDDDAAVRPERVFAAGMLVGVAALVKYQAGLWAVPIAFALWYAARERRASVRALAGSMGLGLVLPVLATATLFAIVGGLEGFFYWNVTHNFEYLQNPITATEALSRGAARVVPFLAVTSLLWYGWFRSALASPSRYWERLVAGLIGASAAAACLGLRFFPHYFIQLYVPLAIGAAPWAALCVVWPVPRRGWVAAGLTAAMVAGWTSANIARLRSGTGAGLNGPASAVASRIRADACADGSLFVWGSAPEFYYHARLPLASRFFFPEFPLVRYYAGNPSATANRARAGRRIRRVRHWSRLMADLARSQPNYIIDTAPAGIARWQHFPLGDYPLLHRLVTRRYTELDTIDGVTVYRRNGCEAEARANGPAIALPASVPTFQTR
ncbi:MAG: glycosyltransferase family 39 protein [Vicinamibacterales bacterium]